MSAREVAIVDTGCANLTSVVSALERLGRPVLVSGDAGLVRSAPLVVLPGVGAFGPAMKRLRDARLEEPLRERARRGLPLLAICLGMQLLCERSEESPGEAGLGVVPGVVRRFRGAIRVPQMGWNRITPSRGATMLRAGAAYFANSYRLDEVPEGWEGATTEYGGEFASALERGSILACQFHPELSGPAGLELIGRWLRRGEERAAC